MYGTLFQNWSMSECYNALIIILFTKYDKWVKKNYTCIGRPTGPITRADIGECCTMDGKIVWEMLAGEFNWSPHSLHCTWINLWVQLKQNGEHAEEKKWKSDLHWRMVGFSVDLLHVCPHASSQHNRAVWINLIDIDWGHFNSIPTICTTEETDAWGARFFLKLI